MDRSLGLCVLGVLLVAGPGCSKTPQNAVPVAPAAAAVQVEPPPPGMPDKDALPDKAVSTFLKAAQSGDKPLLEALLSTVARTETAKNNITFQVDSYQNSKFEVGKFEAYITPEKDGAHVACVWIDRDEKGTEYKHDVIWVLRKEAGGWRIVGMITRPFPDKDPVVFDYEDIPSLVQAKNFIQAESERREAEAERQQASPKKPDGEQAPAKGLTAGSPNQPKDGVQREAMKPQPVGTAAPK